MESIVMKYDIDSMVDSINDVCNILEKYSIKYWLNFGGMLGLVRENRLLPWDNDVEINCWKEDISLEKFKMIVKDLNKLGYDAYYSTTVGYISIKKDKGVDIAFSCYYRENEMAIRPHETPKDHGPKKAHFLFWIANFMGMSRSGVIRKIQFRSVKSTIKLFIVLLIGTIPTVIRKKLFIYFINRSQKSGGVFQKTAIPAKYYDKLRTVKFYDRKIKIPYESESYLEFIYGTEWKTPKENWHFHQEENKSKSSIKFIPERWDYDKCTIL